MDQHDDVRAVEGRQQDGADGTGGGGPGRAMLYRHQVADRQLYDQAVWGEGGAFHARPRRVTRCGIVLGRLDDPDAPGAPDCPACDDAGR